MEKTGQLKWEEFIKVDMRVGTIVDVKEFPEARDPAYRLWIDFGDQGILKTSAQITDLYQPAELMGRQVIGVINFPDKQIANFMSECLITGVCGMDEGVVLIQPDRTVPNGLRIA